MPRDLSIPAGFDLSEQEIVFTEDPNNTTAVPKVIQDNNRNLQNHILIGRPNSAVPAGYDQVP